MDHGGVSLPLTLDEARIEGLPSTAYYIPNFISEEEERFILGKIEAAPKPRWKQLTHRRLQTWPSDLVQNKLIDSPLPSWLEDPIIARLSSLGVSKPEREMQADAEPSCNTESETTSAAEDLTHVFAQSPHGRPNHVLINEYPPGVGIMPHNKEDGALESVPAWRILQEPRSLLITTDSLYTDYLHGIADIEEDVNISSEGIVNYSLLRDPAAFLDGRNVRQTRTSLTYRDVLKVSKIGNKFGLLGKR